MTLYDFFSLLLATDNPVLPAPAAMRLALQGLWAVVLGAGVLWLARWRARAQRLGLAGLVMASMLLPGPASPAHWLGLAFQTPSLTSAFIALAWFGGQTGLARRGPTSGRVAGFSALKVLAAAGVVLGWVLLLDTLAFLPVSVYAWGFSAAAVGAVALLAALLWLVSGHGPAPGAGGFGPMALLLLTLFVLTRLPTGNLWDALIDPGLWFALQLGWLLSAWRRWRSARRLSAATRA